MVIYKILLERRKKKERKNDNWKNVALDERSFYKICALIRNVCKTSCIDMQDTYSVRSFSDVIRKVYKVLPTHAYWIKFEKIRFLVLAYYVKLFATSSLATFPVTHTSRASLGGFRDDAYVTRLRHCVFVQAITENPSSPILSFRKSGWKRPRRVPYAASLQSNCGDRRANTGIIVHWG